MKRIGSRSRVFATPLLLLTAVVTVAACAAPPGDRGAEAAVTEAESELRALAANEIVGDIGFGQTVGPVHYTEVPAYRAVRLQAAAGDRGKITITTPKGHTALWILGGDFATLAQARATGRGRPVTIEHTFQAAGTYYVALRDADQEDADFHVTLERVGGAPPPPPPPPPPSSGTVFDAGWCTGPSITKAEILARMAVGATRAPLGTLEMVARQRNCNELTGCLGWAASSKVPVSFTERSSSSGPFASTTELAVPQSRPVEIDLTVTSASDFEPRLTPFTWTQAGTSNGWWLALEAKNGLSHDTTRLGHPNGPWGVSPVVGSTTYPQGTTTPSVNRFLGGATITNHCYWSKANGRHYGANRNYTEYDVVLSGRY